MNETTRPDPTPATETWRQRLNRWLACERRQFARMLGISRRSDCD